jgi:O-antigen biosynthesis protein
MTFSNPSTRFFIASGCPIATTSLYRCTHLCEQLQALGHHASVDDWFDEARIRPEAIRDYQVVVLYRLPMSDSLQQVIQEARTAGKPILFDTDDLIFEPELTVWHRAVQDLSPADQAQHLDGVRRYLATLMAADAVTVATPALAELARKRGKLTYVHRNALGHEMQDLAKELSTRPAAVGKKLVLGYGSGTRTHDVDFQEAAPALLQVLESYSNVELWIVGPLTLPDAFKAVSDRVRIFPLSNWQDWFRRMAKMDVALAPLEMNNVFCRAKSEIKFVEAGALGIPVIASSVGAYGDAISNGVNGYLVADQTEWAAALRSLIENRALRSQMGKSAQVTVKDKYSPSARSADLRQLLATLGDDLGK